MTLRYEELESSRLYAGFGVRLLDAYTGQGPIGRTRVDLDIADGGAWRELTPDLAQRVSTPGGVVWFPWLEHHRDARGRAPGRYRVRVTSELSTPAYLFDQGGIEVLVAPYDDATPPTGTPPTIEIELLPAAGYPFSPIVPVLRGAVRDEAGQPMPRALVGWVDPKLGPPLITDRVLSDDHGEFHLPMRRAPHATPIEIQARRPPPPPGGKRAAASVRLPDDLPKFLTIQFL